MMVKISLISFAETFSRNQLIERVKTVIDSTRSA